MIQTISDFFKRKLSKIHRPPANDPHVEAKWSNPLVAAWAGPQNTDALGFP